MLRMPHRAAGLPAGDADGTPSYPFRATGVELIAADPRGRHWRPRRLLADATGAVRERVTSVEAHTVGRIFDREQRATHGLAWLATYVEAIRQLAAYAERMQAAGRFGESRSSSSGSGSASISRRSTAAFR